jgi:hypothetical membrane protein
MHTIDRVSIGALALADVGAGLYLIGVHDVGTWVHAFVGIVGLVLSLPAFVAAFSGRLPHGSAAGVLVNVGVLSFMALEMAFLPGDALARIGWSVFALAATAATIGLYFRLFAAEKNPPVIGRHS